MLRGDVGGKHLACRDPVLPIRRLPGACLPTSRGRWSRWVGRSEPPRCLRSPRMVTSCSAYLTRLVLPSAKKLIERGNHEDWIEKMHNIMTSLVYLATLIAIDQKFRAGGKRFAESAKAQALLSVLEENALRMMRSVADPSTVKLLVPHVDRETFHADLLARMKAISPAPTTWSPKKYVPVAETLQTGSYLFPVLAKQKPIALAAKLHKALGPTFFNTVTDERDRARRLLMAAGVPRQTAWNFVKGAESQRRSRAKRTKRV